MTTMYGSARVEEMVEQSEGKGSEEHLTMLAWECSNVSRFADMVRAVEKLTAIVGDTPFTCTR